MGFHQFSMMMKIIYLIKKKINFKEVFPNFITILGLCLGISSIKFAFELNFEKSIYCIVLAAILDAIKRFNKIKFNYRLISEHAANYSEEKFISNVKKYVESKLHNLKDNNEKEKG